jgi:hypothetical protein
MFTKKYLGYKIRAHRWIQMTLIESTELESRGGIALNCGFSYVTDNGIKMVEFHIDTSYKFEKRLRLLSFGGNLTSVRKPV